MNVGKVEALGKTHRYGLVLKVMTARTEKGRASQVGRVVAELDAAPVR